jgi:uncharacterized membrane protein YphA (DoxX/SURF4 family)
MSGLASNSILLSRFVLGALLLVAGWTKLAGRIRFDRTLRNVFGVPRRMSKYVVRYLPIMELCLGALLILGIAVGPIAMCVGVLMLVFVAMLLRLFVSGRRTLACGCFGKNNQEESLLSLIARNLLMSAAAFMVGAAQGAQFSVVSWGTGTLEIVPVVATAVGLLMGFTLVSRAYLTYQSARKLLGH